MTCATVTIIQCWGERDSIPYATLSPSSHGEEIIHYATLSPPSHVYETIHYATLSSPSHVEEIIHYATLSPSSHVEEREILCLMLHYHHHPMLRREGFCALCYTITIIPYWGDYPLCYTVTIIPCWEERYSVPYATLSPSSHVEIIHYATLSPSSYIEERGILRFMLHYHHHPKLQREGSDAISLMCCTVTTIPTLHSTPLSPSWLC